MNSISARLAGGMLGASQLGSGASREPGESFADLAGAMGAMGAFDRPKRLAPISVCPGCQVADWSLGSDEGWRCSYCGEAALEAGRE